MVKLRNLEMFKMFFQIGFCAKNLQRFGFGSFVAPKLKKGRGAIRIKTKYHMFLDSNLKGVEITQTFN